MAEKGWTRIIAFFLCVFVILHQRLVVAKIGAEDMRFCQKRICITMSQTRSQVMISQQEESVFGLSVVSGKKPKEVINLADALGVERSKKHDDGFQITISDRLWEFRG